jgi:hypothetical protein
MGNVIQFKAPYKTLTRRLRELEDKRYPSVDAYCAAFDKELQCCGWTEDDLARQIDSDWDVPSVKPLKQHKRILH